MAERARRALRRGWTTGACAAAAARAAFAALVTGAFPDPVTVRLPGGTPSFPLALKEISGATARAGIVKDAGDDPDVTHGALVIAEVKLGAPGAGLRFFAGPGVGTVTLPGLPLAVGEPAINPGPRAMIRDALCEIDPAADADVTLSIPGGEQLALGTMNGRLGIRGGLSILGTTGIVVPYSCAAWIASIRRGIDVARAAGLAHVAASTGRGSEAAVQKLFGLPEIALIDMGDFVGGTLKYLNRHPVPRLTLSGGIGKLAKLAQGALDLHSARSQLDSAALVARLGGVTPLPNDASAAAILEALTPEHAARMAEMIAADARAAALARLTSSIAVDVAVFDRQGRLLAHAVG